MTQCLKVLHEPIPVVPVILFGITKNRNLSIYLGNLYHAYSYCKGFFAL